MSNGDGRNLSVQTPRAPSVVTLGPIPTIDISFLPEEQRNALMADYARGTIDIATFRRKIQSGWPLSRIGV
jgi:hypothetical protein